MRIKIKEAQRKFKSLNFEDFDNFFKKRKEFAFIDKFFRHFKKASLYLVGGSVRDFLLKREVSDFDFVVEGLDKKDILNFFAKEGKVKEVLARQFPSFKFIPKNSKVSVEISMPRKEFQIGPFITDFRVETSPKIKIEEDLLRRDFTINALAYDFKRKEIVDCSLGILDLQKKLIRAVGDPKERFLEDPSRILRGVRFAIILGFRIEKNTFAAMKELKEEAVKKFKDQKGRLKSRVPHEIVGREFLLAFHVRPRKTIELWEKVSLLSLYLPEIEELKGVEQPFQFHSEGDVYTHTLLALNKLEKIKKDASLDVKLATLFHDLGKPKTKKGEGVKATFYNHEIVSAKLAEKILKRLRIDKKISSKVIKLIRYHGFVYDPEVSTDSSVRRLILKVGKENIFDLAKVREADRIGSGCPKALPFRLRHFLFKVEKILKEMAGEQPSLKILKVNGYDVMKTLNIQPSKKIGYILNILLEEVLDDPSKNSKEFLIKEIKRLGEFSDQELEKMYQKSQEKYKAILQEEEEKLKRKHRIK